MDDRTFYVYGLYDDEGILRYVGKGNSYYDRTRRHFLKSSNPEVRKRINNMWKVKILEESHSEKEILNLERKLIEENRSILYNMSRGGEGGPTRNGEGNPVTLRNIKNGEVLYFKTQASAARYIKVDPTMIGWLKKKKIIHIKKTWILDGDENEKIIAEISKIRIGKEAGYSNVNAYKKVKIYDNHNKEWLFFNSQKECYRTINVASGDISRLMNGKLMSLKDSRYTKTPNCENTRKKKCAIMDITNGEIHYANSLKEMATKLNIDHSMVALLHSGKTKIIYKKYIKISHSK